MKKKSLKPLKAPNGRVYRIQNTEKPKLSNANDYYLGTYLESSYGGEDFYMFTDFEMNRAKYRASRNKEDFVAKGWLTDFLD